MPHYAVRMVEDTLAGAEPAVIRALTDAVAEVYGEGFRSLVAVDLVGVPRERWGVGGDQVAGTPAEVSLSLREAAFAVPGAPARLITAIADAMGGVFGADTRARTNVVLTGVLPGRSGLGGEVR
ncbi:hypothetical protein [Actinokineospora sp. NBRC 105648]|uniref:hypothetical protein n=1 Tax=Actinokineospora sp. NBRC 105648 TaxID=3032206 RepID=UPI00249FEA84|nr:hypothetical protein [Actinokineospora sp. NBRC 105648]GLZ43444.1 hypothetical protein Acsp05_70680 [Actinokineospora sp. NBRC 105648]